MAPHTNSSMAFDPRAPARPPRRRLRVSTARSPASRAPAAIVGDELDVDGFCRGTILFGRGGATADPAQLLGQR